MDIDLGHLNIDMLDDKELADLEEKSIDLKEQPMANLEEQLIDLKEQPVANLEDWPADLKEQPANNASSVESRYASTLIGDGTCSSTPLLC